MPQFQPDPHLAKCYTLSMINKQPLISNAKTNLIVDFLEIFSNTSWIFQESKQRIRRC